MAAPASVVDVDDVEDGLSLKSLRTVVVAQKIVDEKRKEEEALAAEPSLGFNDEWWHGIRPCRRSTVALGACWCICM